MGYATTNPYTGEVVQEFPYATDAQVDAALETGHAAFQAWRTTPFDERSRLMSNAARLMRERREEFARLNTLEMGKLYTEALGEADVVAGIFDHYARHAEELLKPVHLDITDPQAGDAIVVPADADFELANAGAGPLRLLCCLPVGGQARLADGSTFTPPWAE